MKVEPMAASRAAVHLCVSCTRPRKSRATRVAWRISDSESKHRDLLSQLSVVPNRASSLLELLCEDEANIPSIRQVSFEIEAHSTPAIASIVIAMARMRSGLFLELSNNAAIECGV